MSINVNEGNRFKYFAYGSNMLRERILINNPSANVVSAGMLQGYSLGFDMPEGSDDDYWNGAAANIHNSDEKSFVRGIVWDIGVDHLECLDRQETGYNAIHVDVKLDDGQTVNCRTYQMASLSGRNLPNPYYKKVLIEGARQNGLPEDYINFISSFQDTGSQEPPPGYKRVLEVKKELKQKQKQTA